MAHSLQTSKVYWFTMFSALRALFIVVLSVQHTIALHQNLNVEPNRHDDVHILADILKYYIARFQRDTRRLVSIESSANTFEQIHKQADIIRTVLDYTKDLPFTYSILNLHQKSSQLSAYWSFNILMVDSARIFR